METTACRDATTSACKSYIFRKRVRKVVISEEKWRACEGWRRNVQECREVKNGWCSAVQCIALKWSELKWCEVKGREVKWSELKWCEGKWREEKWSAVMILSEIYYHWCRVMQLYVCSVQYVLSLLFTSLLLSNYSTHVL